MAQNFKNKTIGQIGESLVVAELGRRGIVATSFAGNVPDIDILAYANHQTLHLQVKAWTKGAISFNAERFMNISFDEDDRQTVGELIEPFDGKLIYIFVKVGKCLGEDRFFVLTGSELRKQIQTNYKNWLDKHGGERPRNRKSTHCAVYLDQVEGFEGQWEVVEEALGIEQSIT